MKRIIDVSLSIDEDLLVWPGDPPVEVVPRLRLSRGDPANVSELQIGTHTGTHVDPPIHFIDGAAGVDRIPPDLLVGRATVVELRDAKGEIPPERLGGLELPHDVDRVLLKTGNSSLWRQRPVAFPDEYTCLSPAGAEWIVDRGIRLVGTDFLSIERRGAVGHPVHRTLLAAGVVIVEGLDLSDVEPGPYTFVCLPLRVLRGDGGPARALLIEE